LMAGKISVGVRSRMNGVNNNSSGFPAGKDKR